MTNVIEVGSVALITRNIIQEIKTRYVLSPFAVMVLSYAISFGLLLAIGMIEAVSAGQPITFSWVKTFAALIVSALYHDFKKSTSV